MSSHDNGAIVQKAAARLAADRPGHTTPPAGTTPPARPAVWAWHQPTRTMFHIRPGGQGRYRIRSTHPGRHAWERRYWPNGPYPAEIAERLQEAVVLPSPRRIYGYRHRGQLHAVVYFPGAETATGGVWARRLGGVDAPPGLYRGPRFDAALFWQLIDAGEITCLNDHAADLPEPLWHGHINHHSMYVAWPHPHGRTTFFAFSTWYGTGHTTAGITEEAITGKLRADLAAGQAADLRGGYPAKEPTP